MSRANESIYLHVDEEARNKAGAIPRNVPTVGAEGVSRDILQSIGYYSIVASIFLSPAGLISTFFWTHDLIIKRKEKVESKDIFYNAEAYIEQPIEVIHAKLQYLDVTKLELQTMLENFVNGNFITISEYVKGVDPLWYIVAGVTAMIIFSREITWRYIEASWNKHVLLTNSIHVAGTKKLRSALALGIDAYYAMRNKGFNFDDPDAAVDLVYEYSGHRPNEDYDINEEDVEFFTKERDNTMHLIKEKKQDQTNEEGE